MQGTFSEVASISNLGVAKTGPTVEDSGSLLIEYVNGSACTTSDGRLTTYTTRIHLVCSRGSLVRRALPVTLLLSGSSMAEYQPMCLFWRWRSLGVAFSLRVVWTPSCPLDLVSW